MKVLESYNFANYAEKYKRICDARLKTAHIAEEGGLGELSALMVVEVQGGRHSLYDPLACN